MLKKADYRKKKKFVANQQILSVDLSKLQDGGVSFQELKKYFPRYILEPTLLYYGWLKWIGFFTIQLFLRIMVKVFLRPRNSAGSLGQTEVDEVYTKEAKTYDKKHHLTTRGMDLVWRRAAGWFVSTIYRRNQGYFRILDICTGTGLAVKEIYAILQDWNINAEIIGLDYNEKMLKVARNKIGVESENIRFVRGDATKLTEKFKSNSIDATTQVFGIGGIPEPLKVFEEVLQVLKPGGQFLMIDMHKPIPEHPGEWPFCLKWLRFPILEAVVYDKSTLPIVLNRLWGWRDATLYFYFLPLVTYKDSDGRYWGFKVELFEQESQRWWFSLPLMPIAKIVIKKVEISEEIARKREAILNACVVFQ